MSPPADIIIIGGGFAGLSAASSIVRQDHSVVLFDSCKYRNEGSPYMHTLVTWDHRNPVDFRAAAREEFQRYGTVTVENEEITRVEKMDNGIFEAATAEGRSWTAKKLILATGVENVFPDIPGYAESWITGIFHCLYCHGWEEKGALSSGILAEGECAAVLPALHFARQALRISKQVTIYTHGNAELAQNIKLALEDSDAPMKVDGRRISRLEKAATSSEMVLAFEDGSQTTEGFLAHKPRSRLRGNLHDQLGLAMGPRDTVVANPPFNRSSVKGVWVAGDMSTLTQTVTMALATGTLTGAGAPLEIQAEMWKQTPLF